MKKIMQISVSMLFLFSSMSLFSQEIGETAKIEVIINLTRFVDWSQNQSFKTSKKKLYVLTDTKTNCSPELKFEHNPVYKNWNIVFQESVGCFENGSVVYITKSKEQLTASVIRISKSIDILTIAENSKTFCEKGGMINLNEKDGQVKFEINYRIIQDKSLDISSKLLALSKIYDE